MIIGSKFPTTKKYRELFIRCFLETNKKGSVLVLCDQTNRHEFPLQTKKFNLLVNIAEELWTQEDNLGVLEIIQNLFIVYEENTLEKLLSDLETRISTVKKSVFLDQWKMNLKGDFSKSIKKLHKSFLATSEELGFDVNYINKEVDVLDEKFKKKKAIKETAVNKTHEKPIVVLKQKKALIAKQTENVNPVSKEELRAMISKVFNESGIKNAEGFLDAIVDAADKKFYIQAKTLKTDAEKGAFILKHISKVLLKMGDAGEMLYDCIWDKASKHEDGISDVQIKPRSVVAVQTSEESAVIITSSDPDAAMPAISDLQAVRKKILNQFFKKNEFKAQPQEVQEAFQVLTDDEIITLSLKETKGDVDAAVNSVVNEVCLAFKQSSALLTLSHKHNLGQRLVRVEHGESGVVDSVRSAADHIHRPKSVTRSLRSAS